MNALVAAAAHFDELGPQRPKPISLSPTKDARFLDGGSGKRAVHAIGARLRALLSESPRGISTGNATNGGNAFKIDLGQERGKARSLRIAVAHRQS